MSEVKALANNNLGNLKNLLEKNKSALASVLPKHMTAERMVKLATVAASKSPELLKCEPMSVLRSLMDASQVGLEPFTPLQHCYIIPYWNGKKGVMEAQFQVGYRGLIEMVRRSGQILSIEAHCVYENDEFDCVLGNESKLYHKPKWVGDRGKMIGVYAVAKLKDGAVQFDVMGKNSVDEIRKKSKSADKGPWVDFYDEMAKKTILKRLIKMLPISIEIARAVAMDNRADGMDLGSSDMIVDIDVDSEPVELIESAGEAKTTAQMEVEARITDAKKELHQRIKDSNIDQAVKSDLLNKLVVVTDKKGLDGVTTLFGFHANKA